MRARRDARPIAAGADSQLKPAVNSRTREDILPVGPEPDPMRPNILVYEPDGDKLRLVAAEWLIPLATGIKGRPQLFGQPFDGPMEGHYPLMPLVVHHYDLHVWLWKANPAGLFSPTNPNVKCSGYGYRLPEEAPKLVPHP